MFQIVKIGLTQSGGGGDCLFYSITLPPYPPPLSTQCLNLQEETIPEGECQKPFRRTN